MRIRSATLREIFTYTLVYPQRLQKKDFGVANVTISNFIYWFAAAGIAFDSVITDFDVLIGDGELSYFTLLPIYTFLFYAILKYLVPAIYHYTGRLWKGSSSIIEMRSAFAFSLIPQVVFTPVLLLTLIFWEEFWRSNTIISYMISIWSFILLVIYVRKIQLFDNMKAVLNVILPGIVMIIIVQVISSLI